jgi:uncharacterized membrane protein YhiD involved in acid resistance
MDGALRLEPLSLGALLLNLGLGLGLSTVVALFYAYFGESLSNRPRFARLLPMLSLTTVLVISVVKASLALSLGLVGALSIVRFRTAIKDPEELLYLFLAIAIGLGFGADQRAATVASVGVILLLLGARRLVAPRAQRRNLYLNVQAADSDSPETPTFTTVNDVLGQHARYVDLRRLDRHDGTLQMTYLLSCSDSAVLAHIMDDLKRQVPGCSFSFVDQSSMPE